MQASQSKYAYIYDIKNKLAATIVKKESQLNHIFLANLTNETLHQLIRISIIQQHTEMLSILIDFFNKTRIPNKIASNDDNDLELLKIVRNEKPTLNLMNNHSNYITSDDTIFYDKDNKSHVFHAVMTNNKNILQSLMQLHNINFNITENPNHNASWHYYNAFHLATLHKKAKSVEFIEENFEIQAAHPFYSDNKKISLKIETHDFEKDFNELFSQRTK